MVLENEPLERILETAGIRYNNGMTDKTIYIK